MRRRIIGLQGHDGNNIGDLASSPFEYFPFPGPVTRVNLVDVAADFDAWLHATRGDHVIVGGGGLLIFADLLERLTMARRSGLTACWGIGHNRHGASSIQTYPSFLEKFHVVGLRDYCSPFRWVPCASCMSQAFDAPAEATEEVVVFEHKDRPLGLELPTLTNAARSIEECVDFLAGGRHLLTNSYHGAYWGLLLGRRVLVIEPFSSKFFGIHPRLVPSRSSRWQTDLAKALFVPDYLGLCRQTNAMFFDWLHSLIDGNDEGGIPGLDRPSLLRRLLRS